MKNNWIFKKQSIYKSILSIYVINPSIFQNNFFEDICTFCGATDTPVFDFWQHKPKWWALFALCRAVHVTHSLRFTSGMTPADLLTASMAAMLFSSMYLQAGISGTCVTHATTQCETRQTLYRLSCASWAQSKSLKNFHFKIGKKFINLILITISNKKPDLL